MSEKGRDKQSSIQFYSQKNCLDESADLKKTIIIFSITDLGCESQLQNDIDSLYHIDHIKKCVLSKSITPKIGHFGKTSL